MGQAAALSRILSQAFARLLFVGIAGNLDLSNNNDFSAVRSVGHFQTKT